MGYCTAAEGQKFQQEATQFDKEIKELGPSPFKSKGGNTKKEAKA
jgi:coenzyme F420-reducing hydrogenase delta subunit